MRLHRLEMTAFGPFPGTETVDIDEAGAAGLFLLHGPTGAGKTTVLDAVCFALFGQVPGARAGARQHLRSDHAPADRQPRVLLELSVAGRRLEIVRTPEWQRPKRRGTGTTKAQASTTVRELVDGSWVALTSRNDEAGHLLQGLIGMGMDQFTKVVLLPQGDFAAFLRSDAETRRALLSRLFDIDQYTGAETWLAEERRRLGRDVEAAEVRTRELVSRAAEAAAGLPRPHPDPIADGPQDVDDADDDAPKPVLVVAGLLECAEVATRAGEALLLRCGEQLTACRHELATASALAELQSRWALATRRREELAAASPALDEQRADLAAARRAAPLGALLAARRDVEGRWTTAAARAVQARAHPALATWLADVVEQPAVHPPGGDGVDLGVRHDALLDVLPTRADIDQRRSRLEGRRSTLEGALARLDVRERARTDVARLVTAADEAAAARLAAQTALDRAQGAMELATAELDARSSDLPDVPAREAALADARLALSHATDLVTVLEDVRAAEQRRQAAVDADQAAREHHLDVRQHRLAGIASELAADLRDGEPCAVCGSTDHPAPARRRENAIDASVEESAAAAAEQARLGREAAVAVVSEVRSRAAELSALSGGLGVERASAAVQEAQAQLDHAVQARRLFGQALSARTEAVAAVETSSTELAEHAARHTDATTTLSVTRARLQAMDDELRSVLRDDGSDHPGPDPVDEVDDAEDDLGRSLHESRDQVAAELTAVEALSAARLALVTDHDEHTALVGRLRATAAECGFDTVSQAASALLTPVEVERLAEAVEVHDRQHAEVEAELGRPELVRASCEPTPDLPALQESLDGADVRLRRATAEHAVADRSASALRSLHAQLSAHELESDDLRRGYARLDELSRCVDGTGGGNTLRMRLSAYVLAARLEQVATAATARLDIMSGGRYALVHCDELTRGGARSGLALRVVDGWTGVERDTATLSGGESFLASLALALGLADVVQAEAGGAGIETLFIDEGFGTLDDETLDEVVAVLDDLRDGGRTIGVVSHVAELRQRIPHRIEVVKRRDGSGLVVHDTPA